MRTVFAITALFYALTAPAAHGQALSVEYDLAMPAFTNPSGPSDPEFDVDRGFRLRAGFQSKDYVDSGARRRWSIFIARQSLETRRLEAGVDPVKHNATTVEAGYDWLISSRSDIYLSAGLSTGLVVVTHDYGTAGGCDTAFCNFPDGGWQLSGFGRAEIPVSSALRVFVGARGWLLEPGRDNMFPFKAGPIVSVGIQVRGT